MDIVIYARFSCNNQNEQSIEGQLKVCYEYARKNGYNVIREYIDRAITGKTDRRPEFQKMIADSSKKQFERVLVYQLDRFSRDKYDSAIYKQKLKKNGVKVISAQENITDDPSGILMESVIEGMAQYYSAELSQKVIRGLEVNANKCIFNGGICPLGYYIDENKRFQINEETAIIVRKIFEMYASGKKIYEIINFLNSKHYKTSVGNEFNQNSIHRILTNKKYIGYYSYRDIVIENGVPRIISNELFEKCQNIMQKNKKAPARARATEDYLLTTKLLCGNCNSNLVGISGTGRNGTIYRYYRCRNDLKKSCNMKSFDKKHIEELVITETKKILTDSNIEKIAQKVVELSEKGNNYSVLEHLNKRLRENKKETENLIKVIEKGNISDLIIEAISKKKEEKIEIENQIKIEKLKTPLLTIEKVKKFLLYFKNGDINDIVFVKSLIDVFINKIIVNENRLTILFNIQDSQSDVLYNIDLVQLEGFEPPTSRFVAERSIQLSYSCVIF